jgi:hypothetical protein
MQKRYLLDIGSQCKQTYQCTPSVELGMGQGYQSVPGWRGGAVTIASGQMALPMFLSDDGRLIVGYGCDGELRLSVLRGVGRSFTDWAWNGTHDSGTFSLAIRAILSFP